MVAMAALVTVTLFLAFKLRKPNEHAVNQKCLNKYLKKPMTPFERGKQYEKYLGYLFEKKGYDVQFHGAVNGRSDLGIDLILSKYGEAHIVQAKCWAEDRCIREKHIFQLYGSMIYFKLAAKRNYRGVRAVFYTTAKYSDVAMNVAEVLGVELRNEVFDENYPRIKCNVSANGEKIYHLPVDPYYDKVKIKPHLGELYVHTVKEAVAHGFRRARQFNSAA